MNSLLVFSAVCVGLASAGAHHAYHGYGYNGATLGSYGGIGQQRQLVNVPYSYQVGNIGGGSLGGATSSSYQYHYQSRPQIQLQRAPLIQQATYAQPIRQSQQLVSVPYSVQTVQRAPAVRIQPQYTSVRTLPIQTAAPAVQYVNQPAAVNVVPVNVGLQSRSPVVFGNGGLGGYSTLSSGSLGAW